MDQATLDTHLKRCCGLKRSKRIETLKPATSVSPVRRNERIPADDASRACSILIFAAQVVFLSSTVCKVIFLTPIA